MLLRLAYLGITNTFAMFRLLPRTNRGKDLEILAPRHQITVLQRHPQQHAPRRIRILGATTHPTAARVTQTARNLAMNLRDASWHARFMTRDRDGKSPGLFDTILADAGTDAALSGIQTPTMNSITEPWVQRCRHELLDLYCVRTRWALVDLRFGPKGQRWARSAMVYLRLLHLITVRLVGHPRPKRCGGHRRVACPQTRSHGLAVDMSH